MKTFSSILPFTRRFGMQGTCITNGVQGGGSETAEKGGAVQSFLLIHNPHMDAENFEPLMQAILAGKPALTSSGGWSVGKVFNIKPYDRLFFYRSAVKPTGIFAVGTALPADTPEARKYRRITPVPVKPGLAVYEGPHWKNENETAYYVNAQWTMLINPEMLVPFERLRDERPFSRVFSVKGQKRGKVPKRLDGPSMKSRTTFTRNAKRHFAPLCVRVAIIRPLWLCLTNFPCPRKWPQKNGEQLRMRQ